MGLQFFLHGKKMDSFSLLIFLVVISVNSTVCLAINSNTHDLLSVEITGVSATHNYSELFEFDLYGCSMTPYFPKATSFAEVPLSLRSLQQNTGNFNDSMKYPPIPFFLNTTVEEARLERQRGIRRKRRIKRKEFLPKLRFGLPLRLSYKNSLEEEFIQKLINNFTLDVFEKAVKLLPYKLSYEIAWFDGSDDDLLREISLQTYNGGVGDIMIRSKWFQQVEFSQPYFDVELVMIVRNIANKSKVWLFMSTFTCKMWFMMAAMTVFAGFVVGLIESQNYIDNDGSMTRQFGNVICSLLATLYYRQGQTPHSHLSYFVLVPWSFLMMMIISSFTTNFTSMMTKSNPDPPRMDVNMLRMTNAAVGCDGSTFTLRYLTKVLRLRQQNIRRIHSIHDYAEALQSGKIEAAFILKPYAQFFLATYSSKGFATASGTTYDLGSFGFVFQNGSNLASDISNAILRLKESGDLHQLQETMASAIGLKASNFDDNGSQSIGPEPFLVFFIISASASAIALLITIGYELRQRWERMMAALMGRGLWMWLATIFPRNALHFR